MISGRQARAIERELGLRGVGGGALTAVKLLIKDQETAIAEAVRCRKECREMAALLVRFQGSLERMEARGFIVCPEEDTDRGVVDEVLGYDFSTKLR